MRLLLTGSSGFIGNHLSKGLQNKWQVYAPSHKELDVRNDTDVYAYIHHNNIQYIIHSAVGNTITGNEDTLRMFMSILKVSSCVKKIIHFGSGAEYGKTRDLIKVHESEFDTYIPRDGYGFAKYVCQKTAESYRNVVNLRLFGVYGPGENYLNKFISNAVVKNICRLPIRIKQNVIFDYLYCKDLVQITDYILTSDIFQGHYNCTPTQSISLVEIAEIINSLSEYKSSISVETPGLNFEYTGSNIKLKKLLNTFRFTSIRTGLQSLFSYYGSQTNIDMPALLKDDYFSKCIIKAG